MNRLIAEQIAGLINTQNRLTVVYNADKILEAADRYIYRLNEESKVIGVVELKKVQWYQCEIDHLSVAVSGRGIGTDLVREALATGKKHGARIAQCTIRVGNKESEGLFVKKFEFMPTVTFLNRNNGNRVTVYQKALVTE